MVTDSPYLQQGFMVDASRPVRNPGSRGASQPSVQLSPILRSRDPTAARCDKRALI